MFNVDMSTFQHFDVCRCVTPLISISVNPKSNCLCLSSNMAPLYFDAMSMLPKVNDMAVLSKDMPYQNLTVLSSIYSNDPAFH